MPCVELDQLPDHARLWIFAAERPLNTTERDHLLSAVDAFLEQWTAHGMPLTAARDWRYDHFLFVGVDEQASGASGCSIDALMHSLKQLEVDLDVKLLDYAPVIYKHGVSIERVSRDRFAELARFGEVTLDTPVYDNTITSVGELRSGRWEGPVANSWHARTFF